MKNRYEMFVKGFQNQTLVEDEKIVVFQPKNGSFVHFEREKGCASCILVLVLSHVRPRV